MSSSNGFGSTQVPARPRPPQRQRRPGAAFGFLLLGCAASIACGRTLTTGSVDVDDFDNFGGNAGSVGMGAGGSGGSPNNPAGGSGGGYVVGYGGNPFGGGGGGGLGGQAGMPMLPEPFLLWSCDGAVELGNGFVGCDSGMVHRPRAGNPACTSALPRAEALDATAYAQIEQMARDRGLTLAQILDLLPCVDDVDCTAAANGHCEVAATLNGNLTECSYGCVRDAECGAGSVCLCGFPVGACVSATCRRDADCGTGLLCTNYAQYPGCFADGDDEAFACQSYDDECGADAHCGPFAPYCGLIGANRECTSGAGCPPLGLLY